MTELLDFEATSKWLEGPLRLHYHEAGAGPVLIMLHGSGPGVSGWSNFRGNFPVFAEHFRTIVMDMPGFGLSERPVFDKVYPKVAADVVADFAQRLKFSVLTFSETPWAATLPRSWLSLIQIWWTAWSSWARAGCQFRHLHQCRPRDTSD